MEMKLKERFSIGSREELTASNAVNYCGRQIEIKNNGIYVHCTAKNENLTQFLFS